MFQNLNSNQKAILFDAKNIPLKGWKWICSQCHLVTIKTFDTNVTPEIHHLNSCIKWCDIKIACEKAYNNLKKSIRSAEISVSESIGFASVASKI